MILLSGILMGKLIIYVSLIRKISNISKKKKYWDIFQIKFIKEGFIDQMIWILNNLSFVLSFIVIDEKQ